MSCRSWLTWTLDVYLGSELSKEAGTPNTSAHPVVSGGGVPCAPSLPPCGKKEKEKGKRDHLHLAGDLVSTEGIH